MRSRDSVTPVRPGAELASGDSVPVALADTFLLEASRRLDDRCLGLSALTELTRGDGDTLELAAECAPSLDAALGTLVQHVGLVCDAAELHLYVEHGRAALELRYHGNPSHVLRDFLLGALVHAWRRWTGSVLDLEIWLAAPLQDTRDSYAAAFAPANVRVGLRSDALVFPAARLAHGLRAADPALHDVLVRALQRAAATDPRPSLTPLSTRVRNLLGSRLATQDGTAEGVAHSLGMSPRSLARKLREEGLSFSTLLEDLRRERAAYYVERSSLAPQQIAQLLGYATTATFCRAFARWYGQSTKRMRRAAQGHSYSV